jgi:hypothetical protein
MDRDFIGVGLLMTWSPAIEDGHAPLRKHPIDLIGAGAAIKQCHFEARLPIGSNDCHIEGLFVWLSDVYTPSSFPQRANYIIHAVV